LTLLQKKTKPPRSFNSGHAVTYWSSTGHTRSGEANCQVRVHQTWSLEQKFSPELALVVWSIRMHEWKSTEWKV